MSDETKYWSGRAATAEEFLISPRDNQPMVLVFEAQSGPTSPIHEPWVAYESEGVGGMKRIVDARGFFEDRSPAEIDQLFKATESGE